MKLWGWFWSGGGLANGDSHMAAGWVKGVSGHWPTPSGAFEWPHGVAPEMFVDCVGGR